MLEAMRQPAPHGGEGDGASRHRFASLELEHFPRLVRLRRELLAARPAICIERARLVKPQVVFYPNNRAGLPDFPVFGAYAAKIRAPMLVTNRVGKSWDYECKGGCVVFDANGDVLAKANRNGKEEVLYCTLTFLVRCLAL